MDDVFANFDFHSHTVATAYAALPTLESSRQYVALALLALDQADVDIQTQRQILSLLASKGHA